MFFLVNNKLSIYLSTMSYNQVNPLHPGTRPLPGYCRGHAERVLHLHRCGQGPRTLVEEMHLQVDSSHGRTVTGVLQICQLGGQALRTIQALVTL